MNLRTLLFVAAFQGLATRVDLVCPQYSGRVSQSSFNFFRPHILCSIVSCLTVHCTLWSGAWELVVARHQTRYLAPGLRFCNRFLTGAVHGQGASLAKTAAPQVGSRLGLENLLELLM